MTEYHDVMRHWRNFAIAAVVAVFCFGGSCECKTKSSRGVAPARALSR
jgi:hypothetical protein